MDRPAMKRPTISMAMCTAPVWIAHPRYQWGQTYSLTDDGNQSAKLNSPFSTESIRGLSSKKRTD